MILNLTIERQGLPPARVRWNTQSITATHSAVSPDPTIAQLVEQVNEVIPIESDTWGFEDYAVEVNGFECLHFCRVSQVLKDEDHLTIRPWQTQEVRFRSISGRQQISADGRHLIDGVSFGRPFLRRAWRPPIRIQPKKRATQNLEYDQDAEDEEEPAGYLMPAQSDQLMEDNRERLNGLLNEQVGQQDEPYQILSNIPGRSTSQGMQPLKRRLDPGFEDAREGKRVRSALHPATSGGSRNSSANSKSVRFQGISSSPAEATPSTVKDPFDSEDEDEDDDFKPEDDNDSSESGSEMDDNKENFNPETQEYSDPHPSSQADEEPAVAHTLAELPLKRKSSEDTSSPSSSELTTSSDVDEANDDSEESDEDTSNAATSEDSSDSSSDDSSDDSSDEDNSSLSSNASRAGSKLSKPAQMASKEASPKRTTEMAPPGDGKSETKRRNRRRREASKLLKLKADGILPATATMENMRQWQAQNTNKDEFEASRQALLDAISNGGVDVTNTPAHADSANKALGTEEEFAPVQTANAPVHVNDDDRMDESYESPAQKSSQNSKNLASKDKAHSNASPEKRRRIDSGASARMLFGGLGLRAPKSKADAEKMRETSRQQSQKQFEKHQKRHETETDDQPEIEENWQDHIELKSVECADLSIHYSTPPFPFVQRWDPQQHWNNWRPHDGRKKRKGRKDKQQQQLEIEEHYDAAMYDDPQEDPAVDVMEIDQGSEVEREQPSFIDVSDKVDLIVEQALVGAKIAFKHLVVSEATGWQPTTSEYKSATITSNEDGLLMLSLDEQYREQKQIDPDTGETVSSNFIIADAEDEDDGLLELSYVNLIEPKLLHAVPTPNASQTESFPAHAQERPLNAIDAIANGTDLASAKTSMSATVEAETMLDEDDETAVETSFNASTRTEVELQGNHPTKPALDIDPDARDEASVLIREAGFRPGIDPEATRPLEARELPYPQLDAGSERATRSQTDFMGFSSSAPEPPEDEDQDEDESNPRFVPQLDGTSGKLFKNVTGQERYNNASRDLASDDIDLGINDAVSSLENGQAASQVDLVNLHDSSQEMVTEVMPDTAEDILEPSSPDSVIRSPVKSVNLAHQIQTGGRDLEGRILTSHSDSPDAAPIRVDDVKEVTELDLMNVDDLPTWGDEPEGNEPEDGMDRDELDDANKSLNPSSRKAQTPASTQPARSNSRKADHWAVSLTQPEPSRNTRRAARRASAMANTITLSSDDEDDIQRMGLPNSPPPSTAPAVSGFKPINRSVPSASQPAPNRRHTTNTIDLISDSIELSDDDEGHYGRKIFTSDAARKKGSSFKKPARHSEGISRTKSTV